VIPTIVSQIASGRREIELGSLHPTRDLSFVADTVQALLHAAVAPNTEGKVINSGTGFEIAIGELARLIAEIMKADVVIAQASARMRPEASEVERLCADWRLARNVLGWAPAYEGRDGLVRGLEQTIAWITDPANLRGYKSGYII
jgi:dTDP-glucose 4,6-dehydratase